MTPEIHSDIENIGQIQSVPVILEVICRTTGMGFAAIARVTDSQWVACSVLDNINFGLKPGGELEVVTTICHQIRQDRKEVVIDHVAEDSQWCGHPTPQIYGFQSYISVPIILEDGSFFGTLCAIDPRPARLDNPQVRGMFGLFAELVSKHIDAGRKLAAAAEERSYWRDLFLHVPAAIAVLQGPSHVFEWVNDGFSRLVNRPAEALVGSAFRSALPETAGLIYAEALQRVYLTGQPVIGLEELAKFGPDSANAKDLYLNFAYLPMKDPAGNVKGIFAHATDVTEAVMARKQVEEDRKRFRELADFMPQIVWTALPDGTVDYHNARWHEFSPAEGITGLNRTWNTALHPDDSQSVRDSWTESLASGRPFEKEARLHDRRNNCWRWFMCRSIAVRDGSGTISKWFGTCTDIDEQKASQQSAMQSQKLESIGLLAGGVAHDFNNLLVSILGGASLALNDTLESSPAYSLLQEVINASNRAAVLTQQLLAYAGKGSFVLENVDLTEVVSRTRHTSSSLTEKGITVQWSLDQNLPSVKGDSSQVQLVVTNLLLNAAEAIGPSGGLITVRTCTEEITSVDTRRDVSGNLIAPGLYVALEIRDNGSGIAPAALPQIFDPFFSTKFVGRGLGLAAVSGVVRTLSGQTEVETELGKGSTFRVLIPARQARYDAKVLSKVRRQLERRDTVILIDDEPMVQNIARICLEREGYRVTVADTGVSGMREIRNDPAISLVLLDMSMPGMSGRQVMEAIKIHNPNLPVIVCSGYSEDEVFTHFAGLPVTAFLQKPFTPTALTTTVRSILGDSCAIAPI